MRSIFVRRFFAWRSKNLWLGRCGGLPLGRLRGIVAAMLRTPDDVIRAIRARKDEVGLSNSGAEALAGLCSGHLDKTIGPARTRGMSLSTMVAICGALGCGLELVPDPDAKIARRWERRNDNRVHDNGMVAKEAIRKARPFVLSELARKANAARWAGTTPEQRAAVVHKLNEARLKRRAGTTEAA